MPKSPAAAVVSMISSRPCSAVRGSRSNSYGSEARDPRNGIARPPACEEDSTSGIRPGARAASGPASTGPAAAPSPAFPSTGTGCPVLGSRKHPGPAGTFPQMLINNQNRETWAEWHRH